MGIFLKIIAISKNIRIKAGVIGTRIYVDIGTVCKIVGSLKISDLAVKKSDNKASYATNYATLMLLVKSFLSFIFILIADLL